MKNRHNNIHYQIMLFPGVVLLFLFTIIPIFRSVIAFQEYSPTLGVWGSKWIGLDNFKYLFIFPEIKQVLFNTVFMAISKIVGNLFIALIFALLMNEVRIRFLKRSIQTIVYLPHFISWVLLAAIFFNVFSINGIINTVISNLGAKPILFLASDKYFPWIAILTDIWKEFGFNAIIYMAALAGIDPGLYEAGDIDGASRLKKIKYITIPSLVPTVVLLTILALGNIMNANFDQIFNMYNPLVYKSGDILDTFVYRLGMENMQFSLATAVGLFKSVISFLLIITSYKLANKYANYKVF